MTAWKAFRLSLREGRVLAIVLMRVSQFLAEKPVAWRLAPYFKRINEILTGFECHLCARIDAGLFVAHPHGVVIGEGVTIGKKVTLYNGVTLGAVTRGTPQQGRRYPIIENDVILYTGAKILGPVTIGNGAVVGANAVVLKDVPPGRIAVGVPARILPVEKSKEP